MNPYLINNVIILAICFLLLVCCYTDVMYRIISNQVIFFIAALALANYLLTGSTFNYLTASIFLIVGMLLFYCKLIGAGDVKLIAALLLTIPSYYILFFLVMITIIGIPLAVIIFFYNLATNKKLTLPYGLAISASYFLISILLFTGVDNRFYL